LYRDNVTVPQTHNLKELFRNLNAGHRAAIEKGFDEEMPKPASLADVLEHTKDAFEVWRYIFEPRQEIDVVHTVYIAYLCQAIRDYILALEPNVEILPAFRSFLECVARLGAFDY
jgi:hypothetical protein